MNKFWRKNKNWLIPVAAILACALCLGIGMGAFSGFGDDIKEKTVNEANILKYENYKDISGEHSGVDVKVLKDGSIELDGTATEDVYIILTDNVNSSGVMTFAELDMGDEADRSQICVLDKSVDPIEDSPIIAGTSSTNYVTFIPSVEDVMVVLYIERGDTFDEVTLRPVLTYGVVPQTFYSIV